MRRSLTDQAARLRVLVWLDFLASLCWTFPNAAFLPKLSHSYLSSRRHPLHHGTMSWTLYIIGESCFEAQTQQHCRSYSVALQATKTSSKSLTASKFHHALAILAMPTTSVDQIANSVILETVIPRCENKLSIVLKCECGSSPTLARLRSYVGEIYSQLWDCVVNDQQRLVDVVVYPANLPNMAHESWLGIQKDLDCVCSHSDYTGWFSIGSGRGSQYASTEGSGGLLEHVHALNRERQQRNLKPVEALPIEEKHWPMPLSAAAYSKENHVIFFEDEENSALIHPSTNDTDVFIGGAKPDDATLFNHVAVGGTFDGMHYGHRKLLTLAISATHPLSGQLLVGVTADHMLQHKDLAVLIRPFEERRQGVLNFLARAAPGMLNRMKIVQINDAFGPPATDPRIDALVLSHETLETGTLLNRHRVKQKGFPPLTLLCTRRTEAHGMSSTALRKARQQWLQQPQQPR